MERKCKGKNGRGLFIICNDEQLSNQAGRQSLSISDLGAWANSGVGAKIGTSTLPFRRCSGELMVTEVKVSLLIT